jgi:tetratricopeptide (TPR) repeat protein
LSRTGAPEEFLDLHFLIAEILAQKGAAPGDTEFQQAIREGERAVKLRPDFVLAHDTLAGLYLKANQIQLSIHHAREALRLLPSDQIALYHLIQALRKSGRQQELPQLVKRLSELRQETRDNEALQNRYKIFETQPGN